MYAIVDIETTGGYAAANDITEIAIVLHDGQRVTEIFETLLRPTVSIPYFIQSLTGINHAMVETAPRFADLAPLIYEKLKGRVFVAHNVNFDYSFIKHHLSVSGFDLVAQKLCTVRLARKVFPMLPSYSLGNLCRHFNIEIQNRHRAGGDATATAKLFDHMLRNNGHEHIIQFLKKNSREQSLPPNLPKEQVEQLPYTPGVYYFHDNKGRVIYVGKARNIRYRVCSHFTHNGTGRQRQEFLRNIHSISYQNCGTELMAFILENIEIRKYWPVYNSSQKSFTPVFGLYSYEDQNGYHRLAIEKKKANLKAYYTFNTIHEGMQLLNRLSNKFSLSTENNDTVDSYNARVFEAVDYLEQTLPTFAVMDERADVADGSSCILIERGRFYGMGYIPSDATVYSYDELKTYLQPYPENDYIRGLVYQYVQKRPEKKLVFQ
ncbi:MAG: GIY-YIG nuclease family protein [Chitinophagaceae bacterium]|nr:GIY-YIG nuclease family protein [Chitinophagaceae bacterium]